MWSNIRIRYRQLFRFLQGLDNPVQIAYLSGGSVKATRSAPKGNIVEHMYFPSPPANLPNVFVSEEQLAEVGQVFGVTPVQLQAFVGADAASSP